MSGERYRLTWASSLVFFAHLQVTEPVAAPQPVGRGRAVFRGIDGNRVQATQPISITGRE